MVQRAIIKFPRARNASRPTGLPRPIPQARGPGRAHQRERFAPTFERLSESLEQDNPEVELRNDPSGIAPERALVFVTAGSIQNFSRAAANVGLTVISEFDDDSDIPDDFTPPSERGFNPMLYATMPTVASIRELLRLWRAYSRGEGLPTGSKPWRNVFDLLVEIRVWGPEDRLPTSSRTAIAENLPFDDLEPVNLELEVLPVKNELQRNAWRQDAISRVIQLGGRVLDSCSISEERFIYEALLIELSTASVRQMLEDPNDINGLATIEGIQLILPQAIAQSPVGDLFDGDESSGIEDEFEQNVPLRCALFDGTVVVAHPSLVGGVEIEDLNDLVRVSQVVDRQHATSMASLILRGDLDADGDILGDSRILNVPILIDEQGSNSSPANRLFIDVVHSSLLRLFSDAEPLDHQIFVINFSVGIKSSSFSGRVSALGRLLDWWACSHGILFVISAGNILDDLVFPNIRAIEFEDSGVEEQQNIIRQALRGLGYSRTLLAPAECINGLTVGALSEDLAHSTVSPNTFSLLGDYGFVPSMASAIGLGISRTVKPDLLMTGGTQEYGVFPSGNGSRLGLRGNAQNNGLVVASPRLGNGTLTYRSRGTSCATALTTRAILQAASVLTEVGGPFQGEELPRQDLALLTRALAVNSAFWTEDAISLYEEEKSILGLTQWFRAKEQVAKYYGYGVLEKSLMQESSANRATLVGLGNLTKDQAQVFDLPLPPSLSGEKIGRYFRVTIAWFSPVDSVGSSYRMAALEAFAGDEIDTSDPEWGLGLKAMDLDERISKRGTVWSRRMKHKRLTSPDMEEGDSIPIRVQCRDSANGNLDPDLEIRYALIVTLEVENTVEYDIHEEIYDQVRVLMQV